MADAARGYSLKRRLLLALLGAVTLVWLATALYSYFDTRHEVSELMDAHLAQSASLIVAQLGGELEEIDLEHAPQLDRSARRVAFQVWEKGRVLRLHSANAPEQRLSPREQGFSDARLDGKGWRVFSGWDAEHRFLVQVGERDEGRREIAAGVATNLLAPLLVALPVLGVFIWLSVAGALRPLHTLGRLVEERRPESLEPLPAAPVPSEALPLVRSLNSLFERVARSLQNERRFTADAAHELRTPLAALKAQAQVARASSDDDTRRHALDKVLEGCDRAAHLVDQLLTLARLEPGQTSLRGEPCDLRAIAASAIADIAPAALARRVEIELCEGPPARIEGYPALIAVLLRNLLDNAVRYGPDGARVRVEVDTSRDGASLTVLDQGPGIPAEERSKVGQRFYRVLGTGMPGSGLGLSIVDRIAEMHGASVSLSEGPGGKGLRAKVTFGLRVPASA